MKKFKVIDIILWVILVLFVINTVVAYLSYEKISNGEKNVFNLGKKQKDNKTTYNEGFYKVILEENGKSRMVSLKVFFLN